MDPITGMMIMQGLGGLFGGMGASSQAKKDRKESARQFDLGYGLEKRADDRTQTVYDRQMDSQAATSPMRQSIVSALMKKFGIESPGLTPPPPRTQPSIPLGAPASAAPRTMWSGFTDNIKAAAAAKGAQGGAPQLPPSGAPRPAITGSAQLTQGSDPMQAQILEMLKSRFKGM